MAPAIAIARSAIMKRRGLMRGNAMLMPSDDDVRPPTAHRGDEHGCSAILY